MKETSKSDKAYIIQLLTTQIKGKKLQILITKGKLKERIYVHPNSVDIQSLSGKKKRKYLKYVLV